MNFFILDVLRLVVVGQDGFGVGFFLGIRLPGAVGFEEFLNAGVAGLDDVATVVHDALFGLDLF